MTPPHYVLTGGPCSGKTTLVFELEKQGHSFDKKQVRIKDPLKTLGTHQVDLEIYPQVKTRLTVELVRQPA